MIDWLLSDEGADFRRRSICHFLPIMSPDGPSNGWYRVNAQGVDMNRSYFSSGSDKERQAHEAYIVQRDLEALMASDAPVTSLWSMHTWGGPVEPILVPGPEVGSAVGPWEELKELLLKADPKQLVEPLKTRPTPTGSKNTWNEGPHVQFGISNVLCEGAGGWTSKEDCLQSGVVLMKGLSEYYRGREALTVVAIETTGDLRPVPARRAETVVGVGDFGCCCVVSARCRSGSGLSGGYSARCPGTRSCRDHGRWRCIQRSRGCGGQIRPIVGTP